MITIAPSINLILAQPPPDYINELIYLYNTDTYTPIYNEEYILLGYKGPISYRPNSTSNGAIELILENNNSKRLDAIVRYRWNDGIVVSVLELN